MIKRKGTKKFYIIYSFLLLTIFLTLFINILTKYVRELNEKPTYMDVIAVIKSATNTYCTKNKELTNKLFYTNHFIDIKYKTLKDEGIITGDLYNPQTEKKIGDQETIRVNLTKNNLINIKYPVKKQKEGYKMFADDLLIEYDKNSNDKIWCNDLHNVYKGLFGSTYEGVSTSKMGLVYYSEDTTKSGLYYTGNYFDSKTNLKVKKCDVNPSYSKTYKLEFTYNNPDNNKEETITRNVKVRKSSYDIIKIDAKFDEKKILYKQDKIPITITETTRTYLKNEKKYYIVKANDIYNIVDENNTKTDYIIKNFSTDRIYSNLECIIVKSTENSDKTKPDPVKVKYSIVENQ